MTKVSFPLYNINATKGPGGSMS